MVYQTISCAQHQINVFEFMNAIIKYLLAVTEDKIKDEAGSSQDDTTAGQEDDYHCNWGVYRLHLL